MPSIIGAAGYIEVAESVGRDSSVWDPIQLNFNRMFSRIFNRAQDTKRSVENPVEQSVEIQLNWAPDC